jgi:DNA-binding transcriptional regulator YhcF (GntR family)
MNFSDNQSIYLQITEFVKEQILLNKWQKEEKIPSVRDLAAELQVNPNTVMRAYDFLQQQGVIYNIRGIGNHVSSDAGEKILEARKGKFLKSDLPVIFSNMLLLDIGLDELEHHYKSFVKKIVSNKKEHEKK